MEQTGELRGGTGVHRPADLARALRAAPDIQSAAQELMDHLVAIGLPLPSLYVERGGRLRCLAMHGYWQVHDGFPPSAGVIGATFSSGQPTQTQPSESTDYLEAAPGVEYEVAVPLHAAGRVIGVLNVESPTHLPPECVDVLRDCARQFVVRVEQLGGMPPESPAQRLARHVTALSQLTDITEIRHETLAAATDLVVSSSAFIVGCDPHDEPRVVAASGPLAGAFSMIPTADLRAIASWVASGTSCYTMGDASGTGFAGHEALRAAGVTTIIVIPMIARGEQLGLLIVADAARRLPGTDDVERLELLATQAASALLTAAAMSELRDRAARDPLTGLGHSATFQTALRAARGAADPYQLAVLMIDIDGFKAINDTRGHLAGDEVIVDISQALAKALREGDHLYRIGGDEFAAVLAVAGPDDALAIARRLCTAAATRSIATASIGVALAEPGETDEALMKRADAALYEVKAAGRANVKLASAPSVR
jgi:diguanylate cyclase (GGDEF)-like protein